MQHATSYQACVQSDQMETSPPQPELDVLGFYIHDIAVMIGGKDVEQKLRISNGLCPDPMVGHDLWKLRRIYSGLLAQRDMLNDVLAERGAD